MVWIIMEWFFFNNSHPVKFVEELIEKCYEKSYLEIVLFRLFKASSFEFFKTFS